MISIRTLADHDYDLVRNISGTVYDGTKGSFSLVEWMGNNRLLCSLVAEDTDQCTVIGYALLGEMSAPRLKLRLEIGVLTEFEYDEVGALLFERIKEDVQGINPKVLQVRVFDWQPKSRAFFESHGFRESHQMVKVELAVDSAHIASYKAIEQELYRKGITVTTMTEERNHSPDFLYKLYDLHEDTSPDFPYDAFESYIPQPFEHSWVHQKFHDVSFFIAKHADQYIGYSHLEPIGDKRLMQGNTAVRREYRGMGVAKALKVRGIEFAQQNGYQHMYTSHRNTNPAMQSINEQLGFRPYSSEIRYELVWAEAALLLKQS